MERIAPPGAPFVIVAPDHPSLDHAVVDFVSELRAETRYFGRRTTSGTKAMPSLVRRLVAPGPGVRLAAVADGTIVGYARIDPGAPQGPELLIAVVDRWRRRGVALALGREIVARAASQHYARLVVHTSHRVPALRVLGQSLGFDAVDLGRGRVDLVRRFDTGVHSGERTG